MAINNNIVFSELSSVSFETEFEGCNFEAAPFVHKFITSDKLRIQFAVPRGAGIPEIHMVDRCTGEERVFTITYTLTDATGASTYTREVSYPPNSVVMVPSPADLGIALPEGQELNMWRASDGAEYTVGNHITVVSDLTLTGNATMQTVSLTYMLYAADPSEVVEMHEWGSTVQLKTPEQLGMVLRDGYTFEYWIDGGVAVTEVTVYGNKVVEGDVNAAPLANLFNETRRWIGSINESQFSRVPWYQLAEYGDFNQMERHRMGDYARLPIAILFEPGLYDDGLVGTRYVVSNVIEMTAPDGAYPILQIGSTLDNQNHAMIMKVWINGQLQYDLGTTFDTMNLPLTVGSNFIEVLIDGTLMQNTNLIYVTSYDEIGAVGEVDAFRYFKLEDVSAKPEIDQRSTPWIPNINDTPELPSMPSYYKLITDTSDIEHYFDNSNTPIDNFYGSSNNVTINGISIRKRDISYIQFGSAYDNIQSISNGFMLSISYLNPATIVSPRNVKSIDRDFCSLITGGEFSLVLPPFLNTLAGDLLRNSTGLKQLDCGSIDASLPSIQNASINGGCFIGIPNNSSVTRYHATQDLANKWAAKFPQTSNWTVVIGAMPLPTVQPLAASISMPQIKRTTAPMAITLDSASSGLNTLLKKKYEDNEVIVYDLDITLSNYYAGRYELRFIDSGEVIAFSEIDILDELPCSKLIEYTNHKSDFETIFHPQDPFFTRIEGVFLPQDTEYNANNEIFRDQKHRPHLLSASPVTIKKLSFGVDDGVPNAIADKINRIFCCSDVKIDGESFVRAEESSVTRVVSDSYPKYPFKISLISLSDGVKATSLKPADISLIVRVVDQSNGMQPMEGVEISCRLNRDTTLTAITDSSGYANMVATLDAIQYNSLPLPMIVEAVATGYRVGESALSYLPSFIVAKENGIDFGMIRLILN